METNFLPIIVSVGLLASFFGIIIGFLLGRQKASSFERQFAAEESRASELEKQLSQKNAEISRLGEQISVQQHNLVEAEAAKAQAETKLAESREDIKELTEKLEAKELERQSFQTAYAAIQAKNAELVATNRSVVQQIAEQRQFLETANVTLQNAFKSLSSDALQNNNSAFLHLAKQQLEAKVSESTAELDLRKQAIDSLVAPLGESLINFDKKLGEIEVKREGAYQGMKELVTAMKQTNQELNIGTKQLVKALKTSHVRGRYGEIALRRLVESAGLTNYCDFTEQDSVQTEDGKLRPDMTVRLPGHRQLILDSKVPLASYLRAFETDDEVEQTNYLKQHSAAVRDHLKKLGQKSYWEQFADSPDFVIMYMHIESSYGAALMSDSDLIVDALNHNIVFATPSTLIGMLRTVGFMWQQDRMAAGILEMRDAGLLLYKRTTKMLEHFSKVGAGLNNAVSSYNDAVGSLETRVITQLEKIKELGGTLAKEEMPAVKQIETAVRTIVKSLNSPDDESEALNLFD